VATNAAGGAEAERFVVERIVCPSCQRALRTLPPGYPLYDVKCTHCLLRAQVKRVLASPRDRIRGASWDVISHHVKTGHPIPPLFACFGWRRDESEPGEVWFFPFIPVRNIQMRTLSERHQTPGRRMTEYVEMRTLPHMVVFERRAPTSPNP
jgi:hypothetical protein